MKINPKFILDKKKKVVIITLKELERLVDKLEDYYDYLDMREIKRPKLEECVDLEDIMSKLLNS